MDIRSRLRRGTLVETGARFRYDGATGALARIACLDEARAGADEPSGGARVAEDINDVFAIAGEWIGDATVRRPDGTASQVLKQDLALRTDGERFYRGLTVHSFKGGDASQFESFGEVGPPCADFELVVFREADAILCVLPGCYVLAPLKVNDKTFFIECGCFVDEDERGASGQLPISVRGADDDVETSDSKRYLMRSTRLHVRREDISLMNRGAAAAATWIFGGYESRRRRGYDVEIRWRRVACPRYARERELASVTTSYHQLLANDAGE